MTLSLTLIPEVIKSFVKLELLWSYALEIEHLEGSSIIACTIYIHLPVNVVGATELVGKDTQTGLRYPLNHFLTTVEEE